MAQSAEENQIEKANWHWRNTMRTVRFFNLDARAGMPFCLLLLYARLSTLILTVLVTALFWYLERRGLTFPAALRAARVAIVGEKRPAWLPIRYRRLRDFG